MPGKIQSIERAATILRLLSGRNRRLGVVDIAGEMGLPKGTVHGLLRTLQSVGFVEQDEDSGKYMLGAALLHMGSSYLDGNELRARALNWSDSLATRTREAVRIGTLHEEQVLVVHHVFRPDDTLQTLDVGTLLPAHATALGKVLLAQMTAAQRQRLLAHAPLEKYTAKTLTDLGKFEKEIKRVQADGYALDDEEFLPGLICLAVKVPAAGRPSNLCVALQAPIMRLSPARAKAFLPMLQRAAAALGEIDGDSASLRTRTLAEA